MMLTATVTELPFLNLGDETRVNGDGKFFGVLDDTKMLIETNIPDFFPFPFDNGYDTRIYVSYYECYMYKYVTVVL